MTVPRLHAGEPHPAHAALEIKSQLAREAPKVSTNIFPSTEPEPLVLVDKHPISAAMTYTSKTPHERSFCLRVALGRQALSPTA